MVDKPRDAIIAVRRGRPVEGDQRGLHRDRLHALTLIDQVGIVGRSEVRRKIVVFQLSVVRDSQELEARLKASAHKSINRLRCDENHRGHPALAFAHLFQRDLMRDERLLDIETETAENQRSRVCRSGAQRVEIHLLAGEVVEALDLGPDEEMHF
jgi:hypothetical protein